MGCSQVLHTRPIRKTHQCFATRVRCSLTNTCSRTKCPQRAHFAADAERYVQEFPINNEYQSRRIRQMKTKTSILIAVLFMLTGCNTTHNMRMTPIKSQEQTVIYNDGKQTITSSKYYFVSLAPYKSLNNSTSNTSYILYVQNLGSDPVTISSDNVNVRFKKRLEDGSVNEIPVSVLTYTDLLQEIQAEEKKQRNAAAWAAFAGALNAANSAYSTSNTYNSGTYSGNLNSYNSYGNYSGLYNGFSTTTTYDPAKAQALARIIHE